MTKSVNIARALAWTKTFFLRIYRLTTSSWHPGQPSVKKRIPRYYNEKHGTLHSVQKDIRNARSVHIVIASSASECASEPHPFELGEEGSGKGAIEGWLH